MSSRGSDEGSDATTDEESDPKTDAIRDADSESAAESETDSTEPDSTSSGVLDRARTDPQVHAVAILAAIVIGLFAAWLHWFGLVLGGAFIGLVSATLPRALLGAAGFGLLVLVVFALSVWGSIGAVLGMTPVVYLVVAGAIGLPVLGSLVRGIV